MVNFIHIFLLSLFLLSKYEATLLAKKMAKNTLLEVKKNYAINSAILTTQPDQILLPPT